METRQPVLYQIDEGQIQMTHIQCRNGVPHLHDYFELVYVLQGTVTHYLGDEVMQLSPGAYYIIDPGSVHYYRDADNCYIVNCLFLPEYIDRALAERFPQHGASELQGAAKRSGGYLGQALNFLEESSDLLPQTQSLLDALCKNAPIPILSALTPMEKLKREQLQPIFLQCRELANAALLEQKGIPSPYSAASKLAAARSVGDLLAAADAFQEALSLLNANVSPAHVCGMLSISLIH